MRFPPIVALVWYMDHSSQFGRCIQTWCKTHRLVYPPESPICGWNKLCQCLLADGIQGVCQFLYRGLSGLPRVSSELLDQQNWFIWDWVVWRQLETPCAYSGCNGFINKLWRLENGLRLWLDALLRRQCNNQLGGRVAFCGWCVITTHPWNVLSKFYLFHPWKFHMFCRFDCMLATVETGG